MKRAHNSAKEHNLLEHDDPSRCHAAGDGAPCENCSP